MLKFYSFLGRHLYANRLIIWGLALGSICVFLGLLFFVGPYGTQIFSLISIVIMLWMLCLLVVGQMFSTPIEEMELGITFIDRMRYKLSIVAKWIMALTTTGLFIFMVLLSLKTIGILLNG